MSSFTHILLIEDIVKNKKKCYNYYVVEWRSILVGHSLSEGGAKNPSKGTSMKFLVLAADAQSGVGAGS